MEAVLRDRIEQAFKSLQQDGIIPQTAALPHIIDLFVPRQTKFGRYSSRAAIHAARQYTHQLASTGRDTIPEKLIYPDNSDPQATASDICLSQQWAHSLAAQIGDFTLQDTAGTPDTSDLTVRTCSRSKGFLNFFLIGKSESSPPTSHTKDERDAGTQASELTRIGVIRSCYRDKFATPRQGSLVPSSRGAVVLSPNIQEESLIGLSDFSHVWLIFLFHKSLGGLKAKIRPPKYNGAKTGVFATRSPHRPSPIGLSVVKIEKVEGRVIRISNIDMVDGTPLIDIKPYYYVDVVEPCGVKYPHILEPPISTNQADEDVVRKPSSYRKNEVIDRFSVTPAGGAEIFYNNVSRERFITMMRKTGWEPSEPAWPDLCAEGAWFNSRGSKPNQYGGIRPFEFFHSPSSFLKMVSESIKLDPRPVSHLHFQGPQAYHCVYDNFEVHFVLANSVASITDIEIRPADGTDVSSSVPNPVGDCDAGDPTAESAKIDDDIREFMRSDSVTRSIAFFSRHGSRDSIGRISQEELSSTLNQSGGDNGKDNEEALESSPSGTL